VAIQECLLENQVVTVLYGHLRLSSIKKNPGDYLAPGDLIGLLGNGESTETDGQRKHLHLGIHKGNATKLAGYTARQSQLSEWIDILDVLE